MLFQLEPGALQHGRRPGDRPFEQEHRVGADHAWARMRARGLMPSDLAFSRDIRSTAAAPSEIWLELPAVIECSG